MTVSHVAGGGIGAVLGAILAAVLNTYTSIRIDDATAALIGTAATTAGIGLGHAIDTFGIKGLFGRLWSGQPKPAALAAVPQKPPSAA